MRNEPDQPRQPPRNLDSVFAELVRPVDFDGDIDVPKPRNKPPTDDRGDDALYNPTPNVPPVAGERVGPYRLGRILGVGGMGIVYSAERVHPYRQRVALKLLSTRMTASLRCRFDVERQILAQLEHPHIVRLLDGGTASSGLPFLAMEYIDGVRIDEYCVGASITQKVKLFTDVVDAVAHAHQRDILHRDLKPSNVLVTPDGVVKVTDFGLARTFRDAQRQKLTLTNSPIGTPGYAAPEQIHGGFGRDLPSVDVYSLGVMLYELLTEQMPFEGDTPLEVCYQMVHQTPVPLRKRNSALHPDLATIVEHALNRDPAERFVDAAALATQLHLFLKHQPLTIRPPSLAARLGKWATRHRFVLWSSAASAAAVLVVALGLTMDQNRRFRQSQAAQREQLSEISRICEELAENSVLGEEEIHHFFQRMVVAYEAAAHQEGFQADSTVIHQNGVLHHNMGRSYNERLEFAAANAEFDRAIELLTPLAQLPSDTPRHVWMRFDLFRSWKRKATSHAGAGDYAAASRDALTALQLIEGIAGDLPDNPDWREATANQHLDVARLLLSRRECQEAEKHAHEMLKIATQLVDEFPLVSLYHPNLYAAHEVLGLIAGAQGRSDEAITHFRRALEALDRHDALKNADSHWHRLNARINLLLCLSRELQTPGAWDESLADARQALRLSSRAIRLHELPSTLIRHHQIRGEIAQILFRMNRAKYAEEKYRELMADLEQLHQNHPAISTYRAQLVTLYAECPIEALRNPQRAVELATRDPVAVSSREP